MLLDWFVNPDHAPIVVAKEKGYFAELGLDVELVPPAEPGAPARLVAGGQGDIAVSYQPSLHLLVSEGLPLIWVGTLVETPLSALVTLADGPVKAIKDLKGKKVGISVAGLEQAILARMLESEGLALADVTLVNVGFALSAALLSGQVDAAMGAYRNFEMTQLALEGKPGRAFLPEEHGVPIYDELIFVAHRDKAADPRLARFLAAVERASVYMTNRPDDAWTAFKKAYPKLDDPLNRHAYTDTRSRFAKRPAALSAARLTRFAEFLKGRGLIETVPPIESYAVTAR